MRNQQESQRRREEGEEAAQYGNKKLGRRVFQRRRGEPCKCCGVDGEHHTSEESTGAGRQLF